LIYSDSLTIAWPFFMFPLKLLVVATTKYSTAVFYQGNLPLKFSHLIHFYFIELRGVNVLQINPFIFNRLKL